MAHEHDQSILAWAIIASQFAPPFMFSGVAVALPAMGADLGAGATTLGLVETLFLAGSLSFFLPVGRLADSGDKNSLYKLGLLGFGVSSMLIGVLSSVTAILLIRFVQGVASAVLGVTGPAILTEVVPAEVRGRAFGRSLGAIYAGLTLGPICAGLLADAWGWRAVFQTGAAVLLGGLLLVHRLMTSSWRRPSARVDLPSTGLVFLSVLGLVLGSATIGEGVLGYACVAAGILSGAVFVVRQRRITHPLLDLDSLLANRVLRSALFVQLLIYMNAFASVFMLSIYLQVSLGHSAKTSGQVLAVGTILMAVMSPIAGSLADRYRPRVISSMGVGAVLVSALLATALGQHSSLTLVAVILAVQGLGFALFSSPIMITIMSSAPHDAVSMASALSAKTRSLGMVLGMLLTEVFISSTIGNDPVHLHPPRFAGIVPSVFSILAISAGAALAVCWATRTRR